MSLVCAPVTLGREGKLVQHRRYGWRGAVVFFTVRWGMDARNHGWQAGRAGGSQSGSVPACLVVVCVPVGVL